MIRPERWKDSFATGHTGTEPSDNSPYNASVNEVFAFGWRHKLAVLLLFRDGALGDSAVGPCD